MEACVQSGHVFASTFDIQAQRCNRMISSVAQLQRKFNQESRIGPKLLRMW